MSSSHGERCPVCEGTGKIIIHELHVNERLECNGCSGSGWITIDDHANESMDKNTNLLLEQG